MRPIFDPENIEIASGVGNPWQRYTFGMVRQDTTILACIKPENKSIHPWWYLRTKIFQIHGLPSCCISPIGRYMIGCQVSLVCVSFTSLVEPSMKLRETKCVKLSY